MLSASFGDARSDIVSALSIVMGDAKAEAWMKNLEGLIQSKAKLGAEQAIPQIRAEVKSEVKPYVIGAAAAGGFAVLIAIVALARSSKRR